MTIGTISKELSMTEKEYRIKKFIEKWKDTDEEIVLYGTGVNAKEVIDNCPDISILGVMDEKYKNRFFDGKPVFTNKEIVELGIEIIVIAAQMDSAYYVYNRLASFCRAYNISLYDMYGNDLFELSKNLTRYEINKYSLKFSDLIDDIDRSSSISFSFVNTLAMRTVISRDTIFETVSNYAKDQGIDVPDFVNVRKRSEKKGFDLVMIYNALADELMLNGKERQLLLEKEMQEQRDCLVEREKVVEALKYAVDCGKKVCIIEKEALPQKTIIDFIDKWGVNDKVRIYAPTREDGDIYTGLFRHMLDQSALDKHLHIGCDKICDHMVPRVYGKKSFPIMSGLEMLLLCDSYSFSEEMLKDKEISKALGELTADAFNDPFAMSEKPGEFSPTPGQLKILGGIVPLNKGDKSTIEYRPILYPEITKEKSIDRLEKLNFKTCEKPKVSIIIPVYNQFEYTYNCLKSISSYSDPVEYEVIIADDGSTDRTHYIDEIVSGINVIRNEENLKFLLNCNNAAKSAKGEYILFLNNDTQVQPGWLSALVDVLDKNEKAGMVGSKFVYPDGTLQEAGGIIWKDGSAWNYGHGSDPDAPEYNYLREVDYISGASIMIRHSLWKEIGGFDERYAPAYCEDSDLAFEVRKHGYKVIYQPKSVVVHFEGKSNGTDLNTGIKSYQVNNAKQLFEKWKSVLEKEHFVNGINVTIARDRTRYKKHILVIDHYVPTFDKDAGAKTTYMYLKQFIDMGMQVTFLGDNFCRMQPYTDILNQEGIEVLYGPWYKNNWKQWFLANEKFFDYVYLQRPHITVNYLDFIKDTFHGKIFYYTHDLHHVREYREYELTGKEETLKQSEKWKEIEFKIFKSVDVVHVPGIQEEEYIREHLPEVNVKTIPPYMYGKMPQMGNVDFRKRKDILFVGSCGHTPNLDAIRWMVQDLMPTILDSHPNMVLHIVGSNPTEEVLSYSSDNIKIEGFLTDEELQDMYNSVRIVFAPLRYGAGVKGKIVEAAYYQVPVVTTSIGAEGLSLEEGTMAVGDTAQELIDLVSDLYGDYDRLEKMSKGGKMFIEKHFTPEAAREILLQDMN